VAHKIGIIGGDGIGPDVVAEGCKVIRAAGVAIDTVDYDLGGGRYLKDGTILPDSVLDERGSRRCSSAPLARPRCRRASSAASCSRCASSSTCT
jgi:isocitrate/isopropylmalate dehydrogenase